MALVCLKNSVLYFLKLLVPFVVVCLLDYLLTLLDGQVALLLFLFLRVCSKYQNWTIFPLSPCSANQLDVIAKGFRHEGLNYMQAFMLIDVLNVKFEIGASAEVRCHNGNFTLESRCLDSEIPFLSAVFMSYSTGRVFVGQEFPAIKKVIHLTFCLEKHDDRSFFAMHFFDIFYYSGIKL